MSRKKKKSEEDPDPEFQVAPMVDVLLVLLMFFMSITTTEVMKKVANLTLPEAPNGRPKDKGASQNGETIINLTAPSAGKDTVIEVEERKYADATALTPILLDRASKRPNMRVVIRADKDVEFSHIFDVMKAVGTAQIANVTFSVITGDNGQRSTPVPAPGIKP